MIPAFAILTCLIILGFMWWAWSDTRDALHPACYLGLIFAYVYAYRPLVLDLGGWAEGLFSSPQLFWVLSINVLSITALFYGLLWHSHGPSGGVNSMREQGLSEGARYRAAMLGSLMGLLAIIGFAAGILGTGGFAAAYGQAKGGGLATSGYLGEAPMLAFPAIGLLALAWQNTRLTPMRLFALILFASPYLIHGILGARRGPTFMIVMALVFAGYTVLGRRPKLTQVVPAVIVLGLLTLWLVNNRSRIYIGSDWEQTQQMNIVYRQGSDIGTGEDWAYGAGVMLTSREFGNHTWGWRYLAHLIVQPIPRQVWPNKYEAVGLGWLSEQGFSMGMTANEWRRAVGWIPAGGSACGIIADFFAEFSYLGIAACFAFGWLYSYLWSRSSREGGVWRAVYLFAVILSIYVPTQNFNAWYYRFLIMSVPTVIIWRMYLAESVRPVAPQRLAPGAA
jgi:oligosaccharide repeat unit polymerase